jgi:hypothetical protein
VSEERRGQRGDGAPRRDENANAGTPDAGVRCPRDPDVEGIRAVPWRKMNSEECLSRAGQLATIRAGSIGRGFGRWVGRWSSG